MKSFFGLILALILSAPWANAQNEINNNEAIIQTALNYAEGYYSGAPERMEKAIHPDLNKVSPIANPQTGTVALWYSSYSGLIEITGAKLGLLEEPKRKIATTVLKINDDVACARVTSSQFNDYLELVKIDGAWKIVNVLWTPGPDVPNRTTITGFNPKEEKPAIEKCMRDLIEGVYTGDDGRVENAMHPEYRRATLVKLQNGKQMIQREGFSALQSLVMAKVGNLPKEKWNIRIDVLDCMDGLAVTELEIPTGWSYCQLAKIDGAWKIINILRKLKSKT